MSETKTSNPKYNVRPAPWSFNKHPLVSTILWILGTEIQTSPNIPTPKEESKGNILSWRDDHGGHIAEYVSRIQIQRENSSEPGQENSEPGNQEKPNNSDSNSSNHSNNHPQNNANHIHSATRSYSTDQDDMTTASPQWGFYIPITPPQEVYARK
jgi:hypothetical protein